MKPRIAVWMSAAIAAVVMGGCDGGDPSPAIDESLTSEEAIAKNVNAYWHAVVAGEGDAACSLLTARGQELMKRSTMRDWPHSTGGIDDCASAVDEYAARLASDERAEAFRAANTYSPGDVFIDKDNADKAQVACEFRGAIFVERDEDGVWRIVVPGCVD
jgi:hypothetical protein